MPMELITMIEEAMQAASPKSIAVEWDEDYLCFQGYCEISGHFDADDIADMEAHARAELGLSDKDENTEDQIFDLVADMMIQSDA
jgi:hypothetical protein